MEPLPLFLLALAIVVVVIGLIVVARRRALPPEAAAPADGLAVRMEKSRVALGDRLRALFGRGRLDEDFWTGLEEALIAADVGVAPSVELVDEVRRSQPTDLAAARAALSEQLLSMLARDDRALRRRRRPAVIVVVGVNGVGKTTTIAKLAARLRSEGAEPLLGAADTFRAAADTQLRTWADRVGVEVVGGQAGADPASVAFDALQSARAKGKDAVIVDTAGRLHSKHNLMQELGKVVRVLRGENGELDEVLLVLDATTGQNGLAQVREFTEAVGITGIVLTKMDGTAKGGIAVAVERELGVPVKYMGVGEAVEDLVEFDPAAYVDALLADA